MSAPAAASALLGPPCGSSGGGDSGQATLVALVRVLPVSDFLGPLWGLLDQRSRRSLVLTCKGLAEHCRALLPWSLHADLRWCRDDAQPSRQPRVMLVGHALARHNQGGTVPLVQSVLQHFPNVHGVRVTFPLHHSDGEAQAAAGAGFFSRLLGLPSAGARSLEALHVSWAPGPTPSGNRPGGVAPPSAAATASSSGSYYCRPPAADLAHTLGRAVHLTSLEELSLCGKPASEVVAGLPRTLAKLRSLSLSGTELDAHAVQALCSTLAAPGRSSLQSLVLDSVAMSPGGALALARGLLDGGGRALRLLVLSRTELDEPALRALAQALPSMPRLEALSFTGSRLAGSGIHALAHALADTNGSAVAALRDLDLSGTPLPDSAAAALGDFLTSPHSARLRLLSVELASVSGARRVTDSLAAAVHVTSLSVLRLAVMPPDDSPEGVEACRALGAAACLPLLEELVLSGLPWRGMAADGCAAVERMQRLRSAELRCTPCHGAYAAAATEAPAVLLHLTGLPGLERLRLRGAPLGAWGVASVAQALLPHYSSASSSKCDNITAVALQELDLSHACIPAEALSRALGAATQLSGLQVLRLHGNPIGCAGAVALAAALADGTHLSRLNVLDFGGDACISDTGLEAMARAVGASPHLGRLRELRIGGAFGGRGLEALAAMLRWGTHLAELRQLSVERGAGQAGPGSPGGVGSWGGSSWGGGSGGSRAGHSGAAADDAWAWSLASALRDGTHLAALRMLSLRGAAPPPHGSTAGVAALAQAVWSSQHLRPGLALEVEVDGLQYGALEGLVPPPPLPRQQQPYPRGGLAWWPAPAAASDLSRTAPAAYGEAYVGSLWIGGPSLPDVGRRVAVITRG